jgi:hypothetical protein
VRANLWINVHYILSNVVPNLILCLSFLTTALRNLILVFPKPSASFRLLIVACFYHPLRVVDIFLRINPACFPEVHIKEPDCKSDRWFMFLRRVPLNLFPGYEIQLSGSVPNHCENPLSYPDLRQTSSGSFPDLFAIDPVSPEGVCLVCPERLPKQKGGLIFSDELCSFSKNPTEDS